MEVEVEAEEIVNVNWVRNKKWKYGNKKWKYEPNNGDGIDCITAWTLRRQIKNRTPVNKYGGTFESWFF